MIKNVKHRLISLLCILLVMLACEVPAFSVSSVSTPEQAAVETVIFKTAEAAQTQTAEFITPTQTPTRPPTSTATLTRTPLPTSTVLFLFPTDTAVVLPTLLGVGDGKPTKTPGPNEHIYKGTLACALVGQSPSDGTVFKPQKKFTVRWTIMNTGTASWKRHTIDYRYLGGDKFQDRDRYDLNYILDPGETVDIKVEMYAPKQPGSYETTWVVGLNKGGLCKMTIAIVVK